jgi:hypothetical protein
MVAFELAQQGELLLGLDAFGDGHSHAGGSQLAQLAARSLNIVQQSGLGYFQVQSIAADRTGLFPSITVDFGSSPQR